MANMQDVCSAGARGESGMHGVFHAWSLVYSQRGRPPSPSPSTHVMLLLLPTAPSPSNRTMLPTAHQQPSETEKYSEGGTGAALDTFGLEAARARDNDPALHTAQDMFSCGSLSPYLAPGHMVRGDGCGDYSYSRWVLGWCCTHTYLSLLPLICAYRAVRVNGGKYAHVALCMWTAW